MPVNTDFFEELASDAPTPGGGGAAAYCGALACALGSMVANLTIGKKSYADVRDGMAESLEALEAARARLVGLVDEDAAAFAPVAAVYRMPKDTPEQQEARNEALQAAIGDACEVPLQIMEVCEEVLDRCDFLAVSGNRTVRSDAGCAAVIAEAAVRAASLSVFVNLASMDDRTRAAAWRDWANRVLRRTCAKADAIYAYVAEEVDPADD